MADLFSGLEMIGAFLLTPVILTLLIFYFERRLGRGEQTDSPTGSAGTHLEI